jgi:methionyl-tRNA formyltransferase
MIIGYFADGPWSHLSLRKLLDRQNLVIAFICARFNAPDHQLKKIAEERNIPFLFHKNVNSQEFLNSICNFNCDLFVSMSFNQIFKREIIDIVPLGVINCHAGKLPFYRGRNVLNWVLINGDSEFGITVHYVDDGVDTGDIILQDCYPITDVDDYNTLLNRAYVGCADLLDRAIGEILAGKPTRRSQATIHPLGFYCTARVEGDERINWQQTSRNIFNFVRAICPPGPSAQCFLGDEEIRIHRVEFLANAPCHVGIPGAVLCSDGDSFLVKTLDSFVRVVDWSANRKIRVGDRLT